MFKHKRITPVLREYSFFYGKPEPKFKVTVLTYKSLNEMAPQYLTELLEVYKPAIHMLVIYSQSDNFFEILIMNSWLRNNSGRGPVKENVGSEWR